MLPILESFSPDRARLNGFIKLLYSSTKFTLSRARRPGRRFVRSFFRASFPKNVRPHGLFISPLQTPAFLSRLRKKIGRKIYIPRRPIRNDASQTNNIKISAFFFPNPLFTISLVKFILFLNVTSFQIKQKLKKQIG